VPRNGTIPAKDPIVSFTACFARFATEFEWYAAALRDARLKGVPY